MGMEAFNKQVCIRPKFLVVNCSYWQLNWEVFCFTHFVQFLWLFLFILVLDTRGWKTGGQTLWITEETQGRWQFPARIYWTELLVWTSRRNSLAWHNLLKWCCYQFLFFYKDVSLFWTVILNLWQNNVSGIVWFIILTNTSGTLKMDYSIFHLKGEKILKDPRPKLGFSISKIYSGSE